MRKAFASALAGTALATSLVLGGTGTASADPWTPAATDIVGVGTQTTAPLLSQFSADYNAFLAGKGDTTSPRLYSWDATGSAQIVPKSGAAAIYRPADTRAGIAALNGNTNTTVDFARADRGTLYDGDLPSDYFVAFGKDAISWAAKAGGHAPANLTTADLKDIYTCAKTTWSAIDPSLPNTIIKPMLPSSGSGTREFFMKTVGGGVLLTPGACVVSGVEANQGTDPVLNDDDVIVPYSIGHYIGQAYFGRAAGADAQGPLTVRDINGWPAVDTAAKTIGASFAQSEYFTVLYNVFRQTDWLTPSARSAELRAVFGPNGWICKDPAAIADLKSHGFRQLTNGCGVSTHF
ncbi:substrate-binding domain-containing protein [Kitasatospora sp. NPDC097605]|uniref:PstS family phosphate ABC transporter substrate-binding protein n=1 Tax=Kitasatospora sp. NPDC097605 TaxID=3157226 RepID=UPI0033207DBA